MGRARAAVGSGAGELWWKRVRVEIEATRKRFGTGVLGDRRTEIGAAPGAIEIDAHAHVEREKIVVVLSRLGWVRALKGHELDVAALRFKEGDALLFELRCETTDRVVLVASNGRAYTLRASDLPRGRGDGQPIRTLVELGNDDAAIALFRHEAEARRLIASSAGRGFVVASDELLAEKRTGRQVLNLRDGETAVCARAGAGDHVAVVGENRKLLVFPLAQLPELACGSGVALQKYKTGRMQDALVFTLAEGLPTALGKVRPAGELRDWLGARGEAGRPAPRNLLGADGGFAG